MGIWQQVSHFLPCGEDRVPVVYLLGQICQEGLPWGQCRNWSRTVTQRFTVFDSYRERCPFFYSVSSIPTWIWMWIGKPKQQANPFSATGNQLYKVLCPECEIWKKGFQYFSFPKPSHFAPSFPDTYTDSTSKIIVST